MQESYLNEVEATTMAIMTTKVGTEFVAMLIKARIVRSTLKGFQRAVHKIDNAAKGRSLTGMFKPWMARISAAISSDNPSGLHVGSSLDDIKRR